MSIMHTSPMRPHCQPHHAFTLVELLVVIGIIALLSAFMLGMVGTGDRRAKEAATETTMAKVMAACVRFRTETGYPPMPTGSSTEPYPSTGDKWHSWYPTDDTDGWQRQALRWRLSVRMKPDEVAAARDEARIARENVDPIASEPDLQWFWIKRQGNSGRSSDDDSFKGGNGDFTRAQADALQIEMNNLDNSLIDDYRNTDLWQGSISCPDAMWINTRPADGWDDFKYKRGTDIGILYRGMTKLEYFRQQGLIAMRTVERAHASGDYLDYADLPSGMVDGDSILDAWGNPLAYINTYDPGISGREFGKDPVKVRIVRVPVRSRVELEDRNGDGTIDIEDLAEDPGGSEDLNGDGAVDAYDWGSWLWNALPGYEGGILIISAGEDGLWHRLANAEENQDNLILRRGLEGLE